MITLNDLRTHHPCRGGWEKLLRSLNKTKADDKPLSLLTILKSNGLRDAFWCLRALPPEMAVAVRLLACDLVEPVLAYTEDARVHRCLATARKYAVGQASLEELSEARAASVAASAAMVAWRPVAARAARAVARVARAVTSTSLLRTVADAPLLTATDFCYESLLVMSAAEVEAVAGEDISYQQIKIFQQWVTTNNL